MKVAPNIQKMINRFNQVSLWVATEIVETEDLKLRAVILNRFIFIAQRCRELNNFNAVMEILSALQSASVHRLRQTWDLLPPKTWEIFQSFLTLLEPEGNFLNYREALRIARHKGPVVPYLGLYLTDLVFIEDGNPDFIPGTKLHNFAKLNLLSAIIRDMQSYQDTPYCLETVESIRIYLLDKPVVENEDDLYKLSCQREELVKKKRRKPVTAKPE